MAIIYYPKGSLMFQRDALSGSYEQISLNITPNTILYFDTSSTINAVSSSTMYLTASNAIDSENAVSASYAASSTIADVAMISDQSISSSYLEGNAVVSESILFTTGSNPIFRQEGRMFWDYDAHTLAIIPDKTGSTLQVGQEQWMRVLAHQHIVNGAAVYVDEATLGVPCVHYAMADGGGIRDKVVGIATEDIPSGSFGIVTTLGQVHDLNTSMFGEGQLLFLSHTTSGSYQTTPPPDPYETVTVGIVLVSDVSVGTIQVSVSNLGTKNYPFVGITSFPSIVSGSTSSTGSVVTIGTGSVNLCVSSTGNGAVKNYSLSSASFAITSSFIDAQYIVATYNSGSPIYNLITDKSGVDNIQTTLVYSLLNGANGLLIYSGWDSPGILLSNKDYARVNALRGIERESGNDLSVSGSLATNYFAVTSGYVWQGVNRQYLPAVNSTVDRFVLIAHSASVWSGSIISASVWDKYDNGTNLAPLATGDFVVNWVYRSNGSSNSTLIALGPSYGNLPDAVASQQPALPSELKNYGFLAGRVILKNTTNPLLRFQQVDSAYVQTYAPAGISDHNQLLNLQGGTTDQYYHLTSASYANLQSGTSSFALTSSFVRYTGETTSSAASASAILDGYMRVMIGTSSRWIPYYDIP